MELKGKTALVTGAGSGVGRELAREFARQGASVVCSGRRANAIEETASLIANEGGKAIAVVTDVTHVAAVDNLVACAISEYGRIDVLFNNAGRFHSIGAIWEVDPLDWWADVTTNILGPMLCSRAVLPGMMERNEGIIVNMNGGGAVGPFAGASGYGSSKAALLRMTDTLAKELESVGSDVLVFAIGPGLVRSEMTQYQLDTEQGRKWMPMVADAFDKKLDFPPTTCAKSTMELIAIACPELNGRIFDAGMDFDEIKRNARKIAENDLRTLRFRA